LAQTLLQNQDCYLGDSHSFNKTTKRSQLYPSPFHQNYHSLTNTTMKTQMLSAIGLFAASAVAQTVLNSGSGFGTLYYDVIDVDGCQDNFANQNLGFVECNFFTGLSLDEMNTDYVVAMNHTLLAGDLATYCGKRVIVTTNGVQSDLPLFIGDGCARCAGGPSTNTVWNPDGAPGLDFSYTVAQELNSNACFNGHFDLTWEIVDETLYNFDTNAPGQPTGPVNQRRSVNKRSERGSRRRL
jgi:hypothetical protein